MPPLYDAYNRQVDPELLTHTQAAPTLAGIRNIYSNLYPSTNLTPDRLIAILRNADFGDPFLFLELCEEMEEKDPHMNAVLNKRKGAVSSLQITLESASEDSQDLYIADFVREQLLDETTFNLSDHIYDILDAVGKGFSANEIIWDTTRTVGGRIRWVPVRLISRDPRWFMFDWISGRQVLVRALHSDRRLNDVREKGYNAPGALEMLRVPGGSHLGGAWNWNQQADEVGLQPMTEPLAPFKFVTHFGRAKTGLPIRAGLGRCLAYTFMFKNFALKDWASFVEKFGSPIRLGKYPAGATEADKEVLLQAVSGLGADMSGIIPNTMEITFEAAQTGTQSNVIYDSWLAYHDANISKIVLGSTLGTELRSGGGSYGAAKAHRGVEAEIVETDAKRINGSINRDLVRPMVDLNFGPQAPGHYPRFRLGIPDDHDIAEWVKTVGDLANHGMRVGVKQIREKLHLVEPEQGEEILTPTQRVMEKMPSMIPTPTEIGESPVDVPQINAAMHARINGTVHDAATDFAERLAGRHWREVLNPIEDVIMRAVQDATSYDDLKRRLAACAADIDPDRLAELTQRALFNAGMAGRLGMKPE
jgi:phage gp29-like protein